MSCGCTIPQKLEGSNQHRLTGQHEDIEHLMDLALQNPERLVPQVYVQGAFGAPEVMLQGTSLVPESSAYEVNPLRLSIS